MSSTGLVKWFRSDRAYGFIHTEDGVEVFVHRRSLIGVDKLLPGQPVELEVQTNGRGPEAVWVRLLKAPASISEADAAPLAATVVRIAPEQRFGFVRLDHNVEAYVHGSFIRQLNLQRGDAVMVTLEHDERGPRVRSIERG